MTMTTKTNSDDIDQLNSFLRGEMSALETYDQAIEKLKDEPMLVESLRSCRSSHDRRVSALKAEVQRLGGVPAEGSGAWGAFAMLVEGGAKVFGKSAAINALEQGEDHGRDEYKDDLEKLSPAIRDFVQRELQPEQTRTHDAVSRLKKTMSA